MVDRTANEPAPGIGDADIRARLDTEHRRLTGLVAALEAEGMDREPEAASVGELAPAGQHPADLASETFERERDLALLSEFRGEVDENERAAARLAHGAYGRCDDCHAPIAPNRLAAVPATRRCKGCQDRYELEGLLADDPDAAPSIEPEDLAEYLADDDLDGTAAPVAPEEAALHVEV